MPTTPSSPRPPLPRRRLDDAWWLAAQLTDRPARVVRFPAKGTGGPPRREAPAPDRSEAAR